MNPRLVWGWHLVLVITYEETDKARSLRALSEVTVLCPFLREQIKSDTSSRLAYRIQRVFASEAHVALENRPVVAPDLRHRPLPKLDTVSSVRR